MAILFDQRGRQSVFSGRDWSVRALFEEELFLIRQGAARVLRCRRTCG
ncbi:hypothetical protein D555_4041 [Bordetella holmesii 35009]|nr:hypothetical protein D555_4041 [Bordetella holmesii 35009]